ncbi:energy transducer TonB [Marilutibacter chinensis]|uniref:Protein TonB n=1 Tax=Marilutibacter chinensis TaxID=2912247 RepID=A0ABS9HRI5_9GAMM|nr:energy transducer TonB [Lysobacter chinensis]MCF7221541.1 energy transducer TonB [Lysobacter chinensis]
MDRRERRSVVRVSIAAALAMAGCAPAPEDAAVQAVPDSAVVAEASNARIAALDRGGLRERATAALRERRIHAPAGNNAVEYYLVLRDKAPEDASVGAALIELQPYLLIAAEQALARSEIAEAERLLALMGRVDPNAPALPRLRNELAAASQAVVDTAAARMRAEQARATTQAPSAPTASAGSPGQAGRAAPAAAMLELPVSVDRSGNASDAAVAVADVSLSPARVAADAEASASRTRASAVQAAVGSPPRVPRLVRDAPPRYPMIAMSRRIEGQVKVGFTIEPDGSVSSVRLLSAQPAGVFEEAAIEAARRWRFEPGGQSVTTTRTLNFALPRGG